MKKVFFLAAFCTFCAYQTFAQSFTGGMFAGIVASQVDGDNHSGYNKAGFTGGGFVNLKIREKWAVQMEMEFIMKGSHATDSMNNIYALNLNYIEVPLLVQYNFYKKFIGQFGLSNATLISHKETLNSVDQTDYSPKLAKQNVSLIIGFRYPVGEHFTFDFRASNSIQSIRKGTTYNYVKRFGKFGQYHNTLILSMSYKI